MFMYAERTGVLSYFQGASGNPSKESGFLREAVQEGWIDSLHGYGDFVSRNAFSRGLAERALDELIKNNIKITVWIDHGSADNSQNIAIPNLLSRGDNPKHRRAYHTDLLGDYGILFVAGYNTDLVGQNGKRRWPAKPLTQQTVPFVFAKRLHGRLYGKRLLTKRRFRDGRLFYSFCRARNGVLRPSASTLFHQLSDENVQKLIESEGIMILYQHLGAVDKGANEFPYLDQQAREALRNIAQKHDENVVWVAPTSRILKYSYVFESISLDAANQDDKVLITIRNMNDIIRQFESEDLQDISFRVHTQDDKNIVLRYGDHTFQASDYTVFQDHGTVVRMNPGGPS
ncbi:MAG TPA: hypothetical protein VMW89_07460 [Desulfatiglandales bacterium]|nr:hypothetical protein [Desulfatiglandales bacterium]